VYTVTVTDNGCSSTATTSVTVVNKPNSLISGSNAFCVGNSLTLSGSSSSGGGSYTITSYEWQLTGSPIAGANNVSFTVTQAGVYSLIVTNNGGCTTTSANKTITVNALPIVVATSTTVCNGESATITASGANTFVWDSGATTPDLTIATATVTTTYTVTGTTTTTGCTNTATGVINVNTPSVPTVSQVGTTLTSSAAISYQWYLDGNLIAGETNQSITALQNGNYTVETTDANGCSALSSVFPVNGIGLNEIKNAINASVYPNPSTGMYTITIDLESNLEYKILVTDVLGRLIVKETMSNVTNYTKQIDLNDKANGVYNISIESAGQGKWVERIILNR
jgi:hypothetical protein